MFIYALGIVVASFCRGAHRGKTNNVKPDPCGNLPAGRQAPLLFFSQSFIVTHKKVNPNVS